MNNALPVPAPARALFLALTILAAVSVHLDMLRGFNATDDHVYSYFIGSSVAHPHEVAALNDQLVNAFDQTNSSMAFRYRLELRSGYVHNYLFHSSLQYAAARFLNPLFGLGIDEYPLYMAYAMVAGEFLAFALALTLLVAGVRFLAPSPALVALALSACTLAVLNLLPLPYWQDDIVRHTSLSEALTHTWQYMLKPGDQQILFSFTERTNFYLVALLVLILRHHGRYTLAYGVAIGLSLFHQSLAGLFTVCLVTLDVLLRPEVFRNPRVIAAAFAALALFGVRESLWNVVGSLGIAILGGSAVMMVLVFWTAAGKRANQHTAEAPNNPLVRLRQRYLAATGRSADACLFLAGWVLTWPIAYLLAQEFDPLQVYYFWGRLHGRLWALFGPYLLYSTYDYVLARVSQQPKFGARAYLSAAAIAAIAYVPAGINAVDAYRTMELIMRVAIPLARIDAALNNFRIGNGNSQQDEAILYYAAAKTVDTGQDVLTPILPSSAMPPEATPSLPAKQAQRDIDSH